MGPKRENTSRKQRYQEGPVTHGLEFASRDGGMATPAYPHSLTPAHTPPAHSLHWEASRVFFPVFTSLHCPTDLYRSLPLPHPPPHQEESCWDSGSVLRSPRELYLPGEQNEHGSHRRQVGNRAQMEMKPVTLQPESTRGCRGSQQNRAGRFGALVLSSNSEVNSGPSASWTLAFPRPPPPKDGEQRGIKKKERKKESPTSLFKSLYLEQARQWCAESQAIKEPGG